MQNIRIILLGLLCLAASCAFALDKANSPLGEIFQSETTLLSLNSSGEVFSATAVATEKKAAASSQKLNWKERLTLKWAKKKLKKMLAEDATPDEKDKKGRSDHKFGLISLILSGSGILLIWIPVIGFIGLLAILTGVIFGIIGLKKDANKTLAIIGLAVGGALLILTFLLLLLVIAVLSQ